jgi:hypothetical protein
VPFDLTPFDEAARAALAEALWLIPPSKNLRRWPQGFPRLETPIWRRGGVGAARAAVGDRRTAFQPWDKVAPVPLDSVTRKRLSRSKGVLEPL